MRLFSDSLECENNFDGLIVRHRFVIGRGDSQVSVRKLAAGGEKTDNSYDDVFGQQMAQVGVSWSALVCADMCATTTTMCQPLGMDTMCPRDYLIICLL